MYLSNYSDQGLYSHYVVTLTMDESTPLGSMYASEAIIISAYSENEAKRKVSQLLKKSVLDDERLTVEYREVEHENSQYGDPEFPIRDGVTLRVPSGVVDQIEAPLREQITDLLTQRDRLAQEVTVLTEDNERLSEGVSSNAF